MGVVGTQSTHSLCQGPFLDPGLVGDPWTLNLHPELMCPLPHQQMDCSPPASAGASPTSTPGGSPTSRSRKPGAVIESFVNHAPGVFSGTFSGRCHGSPVSQQWSRAHTPGVGYTLTILPWDFHVHA